MELRTVRSERRRIHLSRVTDCHSNLDDSIWKQVRRISLMKFSRKYGKEENEYMRYMSMSSAESWSVRTEDRESWKFCNCSKCYEENNCSNIHLSESDCSHPNLSSSLLSADRMFYSTVPWALAVRIYSNSWCLPSWSLRFSPFHISASLAFFKRIILGQESSFLIRISIFKLWAV